MDISVKALERKKEVVRISTTLQLIKRMTRKLIRLVMTARTMDLITSMMKMMKMRKMNSSRRERLLRSRSVVKRRRDVSLLRKKPAERRKRRLLAKQKKPKKLAKEPSKRRKRELPKNKQKKKLLKKKSFGLLAILFLFHHSRSQLIQWTSEVKDLSSMNDINSESRLLMMSVNPNQPLLNHSSLKKTIANHPSLSMLVFVMLSLLSVVI
jgi:hypothetical protein